MSKDDDQPLSREEARRLAKGQPRKLENPAIIAQVVAILRQSPAWGAES